MAIVIGGTASNAAIKPGELFIDSTSGNAYVGTSTGSVSNLGSLSWGTTATGSAGWGYAFDKRSEYFDCFIEYLTEAELSEMISKFISRGVDTKDIEGIVKHVMDKRHCSEDFIMEFIDYADLSKLKQKYSAEIKCQEYPRLALLCQSE